MPVIPGVVDTSDEYWTRIAYLRFAKSGNTKATYHIAYGSWKKFAANFGGVYVDDPSKIQPYVEWFCQPQIWTVKKIGFKSCGVDNVIQYN